MKSSSGPAGGGHVESREAMSFRFTTWRIEGNNRLTNLVDDDFDRDDGKTGGQRRGEGAKRQSGGVPTAVRLALLCSCSGVPAETESVIQSVWGDAVILFEVRLKYLKPRTAWNKICRNDGATRFHEDDCRAGGGHALPPMAVPNESIDSYKIICNRVFELPADLTLGFDFR
eukprot:5182058-Pleurochrysis_carterae.AAC.2